MMNTLRALDNKMNAMYANARHATEAANGVCMAALRNDIDLEGFLSDVASGAAFDLSAFATAKNGNFADYVKGDYKAMTSPLVDITAGGNGGMASIGRGEFFISFISNEQVKLLKSGNGDLLYVDGSTEEVKHNGGKLNVVNRAGKDVFAYVREGLVDNGLPTDYMPMRKKDTNIYDAETIERMNAVFVNEVCETEFESINENDMKKVLLTQALKLNFEHSDKLLVVNEANDFVRFDSVVEALEYYSDKIDRISFELRANQNNPISFYTFL